MNLVSISQRTMAQFGIPSDCVIELESGFAGIFNDGRNGLNSNPHARQQSKKALRQCIACIKASVPEFKIADCDAWAASATKSSDWLVLVETSYELRGFQVEGKLGVDFAYPGDKAGTSVSLSGMIEKFNGTKSLSSVISFVDVMLVVVPRFGKEFMWWKLRKWNHQQNAVRFLSCCAAEFLAICFGRSAVYCDASDVKANVRRLVIQSELAFDPPPPPNP